MKNDVVVFQRQIMKFINEKNLKGTFVYLDNEYSFEKSCFRVRLQETLCHNSLRALRKAVVPVTLFE